VAQSGLADQQDVVRDPGEFCELAFEDGTSADEECPFGLSAESARASTGQDGCARHASILPLADPVSRTSAPRRT
jgi:hypothetical protein